MLCEINVSSVAPYPESAVPFVVEAAVQAIFGSGCTAQPTMASTTA